MGRHNQRNFDFYHKTWIKKKLCMILFLFCFAFKFSFGRNQFLSGFRYPAFIYGNLNVKWIFPGTIIRSDVWPAYNKINNINGGI